MTLPVDVRSEFPVKEQYTFLNHAGVAPIPLSTQMVISEFARDAAEEGPANYGAWLRAMALSRSSAAQLLGCSEQDVCFVHNTTHGLLIVANSINWRAGDNVVGFAHEFPANVHPWRNLAERGVELRLVPEQSDYRFRLEDVAARIDSRTRLLTVSWVEYSSGVRNDLQALSELCRQRGVWFCVDAIQGLGVLPMDLSKLHVDFLTADGHKWLLAPEGCGVLYVRRERIEEMNKSMCGWVGLQSPQDYGDYEQPYRNDARRFEEGSHNVMSILALGASIRLLLEVGQETVARRIEALTDLLIGRLRAKGYEVVTPERFEQRAGIVSFRREGMDVRAVASALEKESKIVVAARRGFLRASPHFYNDEGEIERLVAALA